MWKESDVEEKYQRTSRINLKSLNLYVQLLLQINIKTLNKKKEVRFGEPRIRDFKIESHEKK